ncbi:hypothetical protein WICPIJ_008364 [Wickerhamomyces pijperi]|uniref:Uncharacterized protein n=1 Tax=Wickerhamomyces pijperi TaxID=599730 RepID=A0A9P8TJ08_WICPI|nr:hypothetical protein WICPIJ_008364 [Wickerhamomyces pijperi]
MNFKAKGFPLASLANTDLAKTMSVFHLEEYFECGSEHRHTTPIKVAWNRKKVAYQLEMAEASWSLMKLETLRTVSCALSRQILRHSFPSGDVEESTSGCLELITRCQMKALTKMVCRFLYLQMSLYLVNDSHSGMPSSPGITEAL